jgi:magnesium transporter
MGTDYLTYALIDTIVDHYFKIFESVGERLEQLHEAVIEDPRPETLQEIHALKQEMIRIRRSLWPLRDIVNSLVRGESILVSDDVVVFLRDVYDHTIQVIDTLETSRDMLTGMQDIYLSSVSNRMNEVMKVLTIIATMFIPMTFLAGIYGMNFKHMPELEWPWAYPAFWVAIIGIFVFMVIYFKRKRWL